MFDFGEKQTNFNIVEKDNQFNFSKSRLNSDFDKTISIFNKK